MKRVDADLWETETENPAPGLTTHAYLLRRDAGNVLFYNTSNRAELEAMAAHGGVAWQFLSHRDEVGSSLVFVHERYGAKLGGHRAELAAFEGYRAPDVYFDSRHQVLPDVEVIPTPGHNPGSVCFFVTSAHGRRYLFTGDTLYLSEGRHWRPGLLPGLSDRDALLASLAVLRDLRPEVVIGSAFAGPAGYQELASPDDWPAVVDGAIAALEAR